MVQKSHLSSVPIYVVCKYLRIFEEIKTKNCEGYDRIPQRIFADGAEILVTPLTSLFEKIYNQKSIPEQWSLAKVIPIHKKGPKIMLKTIDPWQTYVQPQSSLKK